MGLGKTLRRRAILRGNVSDVETQYEEEVSPDKYREMVEAQARSGSQAIQQVQDEPSPAVRLWDRVSQDWTMPFAQNMGVREKGGADSIQVYLSKVVSKCSACTDVSLYSKGTKAHIGAVVKSGADHEGAELQGQIVQGEVRNFCTACVYAGRPGRASGHVQERIDNGKRHRGASPADIKRFSMQPEPLVTSEAPTSANGVAEATQERSARRGRRRRHRARNGSGHGS